MLFQKTNKAYLALLFYAVATAAFWIITQNRIADAYHHASGKTQAFFALVVWSKFSLDLSLLALMSAFGAVFSLTMLFKSIHKKTSTLLLTIHLLIIASLTMDIWRYFV